jgi:preprotein translocase subunit SecF
MRSFRLVPDDTRIRFMRYQYWSYAFSGTLILLTLILVPLKGLNFGVDFRGGLLDSASAKWRCRRSASPMTS